MPIATSGGEDSREKRLCLALCHNIKQTPPMEETTIEGVDITKPFSHSLHKDEQILPFAFIDVISIPTHYYIVPKNHHCNIRND